MTRTELFDLESLKVELIGGDHAKLLIESKNIEPKHKHSKEFVKMILSHDLTKELNEELHSRISTFHRPKLSVEIKITLHH